MAKSMQFLCAFAEPPQKNALQKSSGKIRMEELGKKREGITPEQNTPDGPKLCFGRKENGKRASGSSTTHQPKTSAGRHLSKHQADPSSTPPTRSTSSSSRPSHNLPRRSTLPSPPLLPQRHRTPNTPTTLPKLIAPISMPPPSLPPLLPHHNQHPPPTTPAQRLRIPYPSCRARRQPRSERGWHGFSCGAADAVREVHVVPVGAVFEGMPGGAEGAPAGARGAVAADVGGRVEVAGEAGGLAAGVQGGGGRVVVGWGSVGRRRLLLWLLWWEVVLLGGGVWGGWKWVLCVLLWL